MPTQHPCSRRCILTLSAAALFAALFSLGCADKDHGIRVAFVTNNASQFWERARKGCLKAEKDFDCEVDFRIPAEGTAAQQQSILEDLLVKGVQGIAISPVDAENQVDLLNRIAAQTNLVCHDSDSARSDRLCYVGTHNVKAGREAGKLIKEVLPSGGKIVLFVGTLDAPNARERYEGIQQELEGSSVEIVDVRTDNTDRVRAKGNAEDILVTRPEVNCLVGLWSYNGPSILSAVKESNKSVAQGGNIQIVTFDEDDDTLQGIIDGHIHATVVQKPFDFGYYSVKILAALARGDRSVLPEDGILDTGVVIVKKDNAKEFWDNLKALLSG